MNLITHARVVLNDRILEDGCILMEWEKIIAVGKDIPVPADCEVYDAKGMLAGPGFVDLHCHAGGDCFAYEDPVRMAEHHLRGGTTSLNCTIYHDIGIEGALSAMAKVKQARNAGTPGNILGLHFEGPFLNPKYGCYLDLMRPVNPAEYRRYLDAYGDVITLWTVAPELRGAQTFMDEVHAAGIPIALGHSEASYACVADAVMRGATVCTHWGDATGTSIDPPRYEGTQEVSFDIACLLQQELFCEIINDSLGAHVRPEMGRFVVQAIGIDRVVGVTDACTGGDDGTDLNLVGGELYGSKLRMNQAALNFKKNTNLSDCEAFRVCSLNPARAMHIDGEVGSLAPGKTANIVILDDAYAVHRVYLKGKAVVDSGRQA